MRAGGGEGGGGGEGERGEEGRGSLRTIGFAPKPTEARSEGPLGSTIKLKHKSNRLN